jgi:hypothetical protein
MPIIADLAMLPALVRISVTGVYPSAEERLEFRRHVAAAKGFTRQTVALIDLRGVTSIPPSVTVSREHRDWLMRRAYIANLGTAAFGLARQAQAQVKPPEAIGVFYDENEAVVWLMSDAPSQEMSVDLPLGTPSLQILRWP